MSIDLLLRALRKSSALDRGCIDAGEFEDAVKYFTLAQKLHKKIVERVERMRKSGQELYLDKIVREQEEIKFDGGDMTQQDEIEKAAEEFANDYSAPWNGDGCIDKSTRRAAKSGYIAGAEHAKPRWINTADETPRDGEIVLIPYRTYSLPAQYNVSSSGEPFWLLWDCPGSINAERTLHFVTQWMRLPAAPEAEGK